MQVTVHQIRDTAAPPTDHVLAVAGMFGLGVDERRVVTVVPPTTLDLHAGHIVFITGPSGGGKSTLLHLIAQASSTPASESAKGPMAPARIIRFDQLPESPDAPLVDAFAGLPLDRVTALLSRAGLGDAFVMLRKPSELSDGQRYRLRLAQAMAQVEAAERSDRLTLILADEFGATLDRVTAKVVAGNVRRWVSRCDRPVCFIAATTHDDLLDALDPDVLIDKGLGQAVEVVTRDAAMNRGAHRVATRFIASDPFDENLRLVRGEASDYHALAAFHYRANRPATMTRVLALRHDRPTVVGRFLGRRGQTRSVGVLVESLPSLACTMRDAALGNRYAALPPRARPRALNAEVRCISRVVVHPQWRGLGLAVRLVRAALDEPTTRYTEALAAMGRVHPFFERAGMTAYPRPPHEADARLTAALRRVGLRPIDLAGVSRARVRVERLADGDRRWFVGELRRWHRGRSRCCGKLDDLDALLRFAQRRLAFEPVYYLHDNRKSKSEGLAGDAGSAENARKR